LKFQALANPKLDLGLDNTDMKHGRYSKIDTTNCLKDPVALQTAMLRREAEVVEQAMVEQRKLEGVFREARERERLERGRLERERLERERLEKERLEREREKNWQRVEGEKAERVKKAAALRRAVDEEMYIARKESVLREQMEREAELRAEQEVRAERERKRAEKERQVRKKVKELEEAAVAKAVEESIITEAARKLVEQEETEKKRLAVVAGRMMKEAEAKAQADRLRRRVEGKNGQDWVKGGAGINGFEDNVGFYGAGLPPLGMKIHDVRAFVEDDLNRTPSPPFIDSHSPTYPGGSRGNQFPLPKPTWYEYTPPLTSTSLAGGKPESHAYASGRWDAGHESDRLDQLENTLWRDAGRETRRWRETTTERWETVIHREEGGRDAQRRYKAVSKSTSRPV